jgi:purine-binding chemotaxis protein CheW
MVANAGRDSFQDDELWDEDDEDAMKDRYLTFRVGNEVYGLDIEYVIEIVGMQKITEVPDMPEFVKGVINLRGQVIPVIDVRSRFCMENRAYDDRTCVIVVNINENSIGLVVDMVNEVLDIPEENVSPPPKVTQGSSSRYLKGMGKVGDQVKILLDVQRLLFNEELEQLGAAS